MTLLVKGICLEQGWNESGREWMGVIILINQTTDKPNMTDELMVGQIVDCVGMTLAKIDNQQAKIDNQQATIDNRQVTSD